VFFNIAKPDFSRSEREIAEGVTVGRENSREELEEFFKLFGPV
jgi:hypothetical protein